MEIRLIGSNVILRTIKLEDAEFTANLRSNPRINEFLSSSETILVESQEKWISDFLNQRDDYYFIIERLKTNERVGTISIYNIDTNLRTAEFGRYIALDSICAIESEYLILKFVFEILKLNQLYCRTADQNFKVWNQHLSFGFKNVGFELFPKKYFFLRRQQITQKEFLEYDYSKIIKIIERFNNI